MKIGFLILNYNSCDLSRKLAEKVSGFQNIDLVVVVDNCSSDDSFNQLTTIINPKIYVIKSERNGGYAYGNNFGAKYCEDQGVDILFISNPDVDIEEKDINQILNAFDKSDYSVLSGVEYDINKNISQPPIWKMSSYKDDLLDCYYIGRRISKTKKGIQLNPTLEIQKTELVKGSFLAVKLTDFLSVGGFDENTFLFCEERILGKRMEIAGKKVGVVTNARYLHNHSVSINKSYRSVAKQISLLYDSRLYYNRQYNRIGRLKMFFLKCSMLISVVEYKIAGLTR